MKRHLLLFFLIGSVYAFGQGRTEESQSVNLEILGLQYNYEKPLSEKFTVNYHGGLAGALGYSYASYGWYEEEKWRYSMRGVVGADFRFYYNLAKREAKGKSTRRNSGNFWAVDLQYYSPTIINKGFNDSYIVFATPYWGIRRVYSNHWLFELNLGYAVGFDRHDFVGGVVTNIKFGYSF